MPALTRLALDLAGLGVTFEAAGDEWPTALAPRYGAFASDRPSRFRIRLTSRGNAPTDAAQLARLTAEPVTLELAGARLHLRSPSLAGEVDLARGRGELAAPLHRHGVDVLLRALLTVEDEKALLVHGALAATGGTAYLCAGPSGAGKSTLATLLGERAFCDELALLRRGRSGWTAHALPFWHGRPGGGALAGVRLLVHGEQHALRSLSAAEALRRLAAEVVWPAFSPPAAARALELVGCLLAEVPVAELAFRPVAGVWPVLAGEVAA